MNRRRFLKLAGIASVGAALQISLIGGASRTDAAESAGRRLYRGDRRGRIYASRDAGRTWQLHTDLGPQYSIRRMGRERNGRVGTSVVYRGREFKLKLATDEQSWRTN